MWLLLACYLKLIVPWLCSISPLNLFYPWDVVQVPCMHSLRAMPEPSMSLLFLERRLDITSVCLVVWNASSLHKPPPTPNFFKSPPLPASGRGHSKPNLVVMEYLWRYIHRRPSFACWISHTPYSSPLECCSTRTGELGTRHCWTVHRSNRITTRSQTGTEPERLHSFTV